MTETDPVPRLRTLLDLGRHHEAKETAMAALAADPTDPRLHFLAALAVAETDGAAAALEHADRAVALAPDHPSFLGEAGRLRSHLGKHSEALQLIRRAVSLGPENADLHVMLTEALLYSESSRRRLRTDLSVLAEAGRHADEAVRLAPDDPVGHLGRAKVALAREDANGAAYFAREALRIEPDHPVGHQLLGLAAQVRGDMRAAGDHYVAAGRADPHSKQSLSLLRGLRSGAPLGVFGAWVVFRLVVGLGRTGQTALVAAAVVFAVGVVLYKVAYPRVAARAAMSPQARQVLREDRRTRRRRFGRRP